MAPADDLFTFAARYPNAPGSKTGGASAIAAEQMREPAVRIDDQILAFLKAHGPECPDRIAALMGLDILTTRPALSRLTARGKVEKLPLEAAEGVSRRGNRAHHYKAI
jgi:predicted ArsR family transcriptional regulator